MRTFVTVHNADLFRHCDRRFADLDPVYLFVGPRQPPARADVIHCAARPGNLEHLRLFYDFTGWHVLAGMIRSGEIAAERLLLLQYDMRLLSPARRVVRVLGRLLDTTPGPVGFQRGDSGDWSAVDPTFAALFREAMASKDIDADGLPVDAWPVQQGLAWRVEDFREFMDWFTPLFDVFADHLLAGHLAERTIHAWSHATGRPVTVAGGLVAHDRCDSHGTTALFYGDVAGYEAKAATFAR